MMSDESLQRKDRSETILKKEGVPVISHLPVIEDHQTAQFRSLEQVAWRAMALNIVACKGAGLEQQEVLRIIKDYSLENVLTPKEKEFVLKTEPSEKEMSDFSWRFEAYWVLLWAISYIENLGRPEHVCEVKRAIAFMADRTALEFIANGSLRQPAEILDGTDLIYRYHWACREAQLNGRAVPARLNADVVIERHHAFNWLVGYGDSADWDDVSTDT